MSTVGNSFAKRLITDGSMTGTAAVTSTVFDIQDLSLLSLHLVWTGTPNGTFSVQGSNNYDPAAGTGDWVALTLSPSVSASGSASSALINLAQLGFAWLRVVYTNSSSTGTLQCYAFGKAL